MVCEICACDTSVDSVMWTCAGCPRMFHATCIGVTVQRNSLRRKDRKVSDFTSYILPCCESCQELLQAKLDFKSIAEQQKSIEKQLNGNAEVMHRLTFQQEKPNLVHEAIDGIEILLTSMKNELAAINKSNSLAGSVVAIKNHITSLLDTATMSTKENVNVAVKSVTSELSTDLRNLNDEVSHLTQLSLDTAASCTMQTNSMLELEILDEVKALSANIAHHTAWLPSSPDLHPSLEVELNKEKDADSSGWRLIGTRRVWKADWSEYDARKLRRSNQQKQADNAKRRRKRQSRRYQNINNFSLRNHRNNHNNNNNNNNNNNRRTIFGFNNNHGDNNYNRSNLLPTDRELLTVAKDRFSKPPVNYTPSMRFEKGEILNPYPVSGTANSHWLANPSTSTEACLCRHSCFRRN